MKPMGSAAKELFGQDYAQRMNQGDPRCASSPGLPEAEETEIAYPEDRYGVSCIGCGKDA